MKRALIALFDERFARRTVIAICVLAFGLRIAASVLLDTTASANSLSVWMWGREPACLADALARGDGFSDPFGRDTGPSGWLTPIYSSLIALVLRNLARQQFRQLSRLRRGPLQLAQGFISKSALPHRSEFTDSSPPTPSLTPPKSSASIPGQGAGLRQFARESFVQQCLPSI